MRNLCFFLFGLFTLGFCDDWNELTIDLNNMDVLTSAIFIGVNEAFELNQQGLDALTGNDFERAEQLFRQAASIVPIYSSPRNNLGVVFFRTDREKDAAQIWRNITLSDPEYIMAWFNLGLYYFRIQDFTQAISVLGQAYSKEPNNEAVWSLLAYILTIDGQNSRAKEILRTKMNNFQALKMLGEIYTVERNFESARFVLEQLRTPANPNRDFFETLAVVYNELGMFEKTIALFEEATARRDRISTSFRITYAWALYAVGNTEESAVIFRRLFAGDEENRHALASLIYILTSQEKFDEALAILQDLSIDGIELMKQQVILASRGETRQIPIDTEGLSEVEVLFNIALSYHISGNTERAQELYEKVLAKDRNFFRAWNNLAVIFAANGEIDRAIRTYRRATGRRVEISDGYVNLVNLFWILEEPRSARRWLRRGLRRHSENEILLEFRELLK